MHLRTALALLFLPALCCAQDTTDAFTIEGRFDAFTTDDLGNMYALQGDELRLFDARGRSWLRNSTKTFGRIGTIDAFYSLKPMLFAPEQGQIAVLDNTLSLQGSVINLPREGFTQVTAACMSVQNHFWLFDQRELALLRTDEQLRVRSSTGRLDQQLGFAPEPRGMLEHDSRLYVNDPAHGIIVFDVFGTFMRTLPVVGTTAFGVRGHLLWSFGPEGLQAMDLRSFQTRAIALPADVTDVREARIEQGRLHLLTAEGVVVRPMPAGE